MTDRDTWCSSLSESCTRQVSGVGGRVRVLHGASALVLLKCACGARVRVCARADARAGVGCGRARERERESVCVRVCARFRLYMCTVRSTVQSIAVEPCSHGHHVATNADMQGRFIARDTCMWRKTREVVRTVRRWSMRSGVSAHPGQL
jgi:hypothetical protein